MKKLIFTLIIGFLLGGCDDVNIERKIQDALSKSYSNPPKIEAFMNVGDLIKNLSSKSSLSFNEWTKSKFADGSQKWSSNTAIQQFGKYSKNGFQNDIGYVVYGKEEGYCNEIQIVLNIKNPSEYEEALSSLSVWTEQTFGKLEIKIPDNLNKSILEGRQFAYESESVYILLQKEIKTEKNYNIHPQKKLDEEVTYESWKLIGKSK